MKKILIFLFVTLNLNAQKFETELGLGLGFGTANNVNYGYLQNHNFGFGWQAGAGYFINDILTVGLRGGSTLLSYQDQNNFSSDEKFKFSLGYLNPYVKYQIFNAQPISIDIIGEGGLHFFKYSVTTWAIQLSRTGFDLGAGASMNYGIGQNLSIFSNLLAKVMWFNDAGWTRSLNMQLNFGVRYNFEF